MSSLDPSKNGGSQKPPPTEDATRFVSGNEGEAESNSKMDGEFEIHDDVAAGAADLVGVLGEYLLLEPIGAGGMGQVFRAEHRTMNREVALKVLSREIADRPNVLQQFFAEIRAVAKLMHPNIVTAFDAGSVGQMHYLVMELVNGEILSQRVREQGPLSTGQAVGLLEQAAGALAYAHGMGVVHRDIKPGNLMLTTTGVLKILDFGLARLSTQAGMETNKRFFMGTPEYMSPEQIENADDVDGRSDLYSLGATLYYLLAGQPMFSGEKMRVARAHLQETPKPLFEVRSDVDLRLDSIFQRLVAKRPEDRYASAQDLLDNLAQLNLNAKTTKGNALRKGGYRLGDESSTNAGFGVSTLAKKSQIVGVDLGLLTSIAAYYDPTFGPQVIDQGDGNPQYLRNMVWSAGKNIRIGSEALALRQVDPDKIFHSIQRWIGLREIARPFGGEIVPPEVLLAAILRQIMQNSATETDNSMSAILTSPSCYDQMHRRALRNACKIAGIELVQLLDRPLAAALCWLDVNCRLSTSQNRQLAVDERLLIVQLSGTGLDATVVHAYGTVVKQLGSCGHWKFGEQRWQYLLAQHFSEMLKAKTGKSIREDVAAATRLQRTVELAINQLSRSSKVEVRFDWLGASIHQVVTQQGLMKIAPELKQIIQQSVAKACSIAKMDLSEIDHVLLAGSIMHMNAVQKVVADLIPHNVDMNFVDRGDFARGAAIQAHSGGKLGSDSKELNFKAVSAASYDIALLPDLPDKSQSRPTVLIEKGTTTPTSFSRTLRPKVVNGVCSELPTFHLIESTSLGEGQWLKLGGVNPAEVFPDRGIEEALQLRLEIDDSGMLQSTISQPSSNQRVLLPAASDPELTPDEISKWRDWLETTLLCAK